MSSTTDTAKEQAGHLAGTAKSEAASVADEAKAQARNVMDDARTRVDEQSRTGRDRLVETSRTLGSDLEQMAANGPDGMASDLARQLAQKAREVGDMLDGREPSDILEDVRAFARRRPGTFLLGALAAGVVFGRVARGAKDAKSTDSTTGYGTAGLAGTGTTGYGTTGTGTGVYSGTTGTGAYAGTTGTVDAGALDTGYATTSGAPAYSDTSGLGAGGYDPATHAEGPGDTASPTSYEETSQSGWSDTPLGDEAERRAQ